MPKRVVIADAGPLIGLARIGQLALLPRLFGTVTVTSWVRQEVLAGGDFPDTRALQEAFSQSLFGQSLSFYRTAFGRTGYPPISYEQLYSFLSQECDAV